LVVEAVHHLFQVLLQQTQVVTVVLGKATEAAVLLVVVVVDTEAVLQVTTLMTV
jgi:hypothetical protein